MNGSAAIGILGGVVGFLLATLLPAEIIEALGFTALVTGLFTALARALADARRADEDRTRALTAFGFFYGLALSVLAIGVALIFDLLD